MVQNDAAAHPFILPPPVIVFTIAFRDELVRRKLDRCTPVHNEVKHFAQRAIVNDLLNAFQRKVEAFFMPEHQANFIVFSRRDDIIALLHIARHRLL